MKFFTKFFFFLGLSFLTAVPLAQADLFISPLRVAFEGRDRSALVTLMNRSKTVNTYRIYWTDKVYSTEKNNYIDVDELGTAGGGVSELVRYSPRQITLKPGEKQKVRLAVRKPSGLAAGEYRSHLVFEKIPNIPAQTKDGSEGATMKLYVNLSFAIPIIVREGVTKDDVTSTIQNMSLAKDAETNTPVLNITLAKQGALSTYGKIMVYNAQADGTKGSVVGILNNAAVLKENDSRQYAVDLDESPITSNQLVVVYKGDAEFRDRVWDEQIINFH